MHVASDGLFSRVELACLVTDTLESNVGASTTHVEEQLPGDAVGPLQFQRGTSRGRAFPLHGGVEQSGVIMQGGDHLFWRQPGGKRRRLRIIICSAYYRINK